MKNLIVSFVAMTVVFPAYGADRQEAMPREVDQRDVDQNRETPASPESKKRQNGYDAAVRQCQSQSGTAKQECVEGAKMKYGEMLK